MNVKTKYKKGNIFHTKSGTTIRVLDSFEGYVFARKKGCVPFVLAEKQFDEMLKKEVENYTI